jgi:hypothetical protein
MEARRIALQERRHHPGRRILPVIGAPSGLLASERNFDIAGTPCVCVRQLSARLSHPAGVHIVAIHRCTGISSSRVTMRLPASAVKVILPLTFASILSFQSVQS